MSLSRVTTWVAGQVLTASALNGEFNNILNNPIGLISPTTAAINFNLQGHSNLPITALSATSGSTGLVLSLSSGSALPQWSVLPITGGLTTGVSSTGTMFYVSSSGVLIPLPIGSAGQVITVTSSVPAWQTPASAVSGLDPESNYLFYEDFQSFGAAQTTRSPFNTTSPWSSGIGTFQAGNAWMAHVSTGGGDGNVHVFASVTSSDTSKPSGNLVMGANVSSTVGIPFSFIYPNIGATDGTANLTSGMLSQVTWVQASQSPTFKTAFTVTTSNAVYQMVGLTGKPITTSSAQQAIFLRSENPAANVSMICVSTSGGETVASLGVTATAKHTYKLVISTTQVDGYVDGVLTTSITGATIPRTAGLTPFAGHSATTVSAAIGSLAHLLIDYITVASTR
jgi:hypothetical protein